MDHMNHGAHAGHGDHSGHDGHAGHGDHSDPAGHIMKVLTTTVATVLDNMAGSSKHGDHLGMSYSDQSDHGEHGGGHGGHGDGGGHSGMAMWFHTGYNEKILFESWAVTTIGGLIGSMIGIFFMAAFYEGLKYYREHLFYSTYNALQYRSVTIPAEKGVVPEDNQIVQPTMFSWMHGFQTFLHIIQIVLSYFLMLIFMTYNVWLCLAVVLGTAVGYFLFGWKKLLAVDLTEHCH